MHVPSVYVFSVCMSLCMYVPSVCMFLCLVVPSFVCYLHVYVPSCVRPSVCTFLPSVCPSICMSASCVSPSACMFLRMIVVGIRTPRTTGRCGRSVEYTGSRLCPRQFGRWGGISGVHRLMSVPTSVGSLRYICSFVNCLSVLSSLRIRPLSCRQLRVRLLFCCVSIDARRDGTQWLT